MKKSKNIRTIITSTISLISGLIVASKPFVVDAANGADVQPIQVPQQSLFGTDLGIIISNLLTFITIIAAIIVFVYLIWGGIEWITSGGDKGKTEQARNKITAAVVGMIVLAAAYAILQLILAFLGVDLNSLLQSIPTINDTVDPKK